MVPTKARREKEAKLKTEREKTAKESKWLNNRPEKQNVLGTNLTDQQPPEPRWKLRGGLREADEQGNWVTSSSIGQGGPARSAARNQRIEKLKVRYPRLWGIKGNASRIAIMETKAGHSIDARTIQKYFKEK
jgi:hypothetical protein